MAKSPKSRKLELDEFGFDPGLDVPDFDFDMSPPKDDRNPVTKAGKAFLGGAKDTALTPSFLARLMRKSLPKGYGSVMDLADDTAGSLKNLYNTSAQETKPVIGEIKRVVARAIPSAEKALPRKWTERLKNWSREDSANYAGLSPQAQREAGMQLQIADIMKFQTEQGLQNRSEDFVRDKLKEGIDQARHRDSLSQLDAIRQAVSQQAAYQSKIESNFQRKSLELQFRSYFTLVDSLEETKRQGAKTTEALAGILKNTGLPDSVKLRSSERWMDMTRNKFMESMNDGLFASRRNFMRNLGARAAGAAKERVSSFMGNVRSGIDMANVGLDTKEMMSDFGGPSGAEMGSSIAGSAAADLAGGWVGKKIGKKLAKHQGVVRGGNRAQQFSENFPQIAGEWARSNKGETGVGLLDFLLGMGKDSVLSSLSQGDRTLNLDRLQNMQDQSIYTRHANKSITEIIPGFLARIYQELQIIRTGDAKVPLTVYDISQNKFNDRKSSFKNAHRMLFSEGQKRSVNSQLDGLIDQIDPEKTLSAEERADLGKQLLSANMGNRYGNKEFLTGANTFSGASGAKYAGLFGKHLEGDSNRGKELDLTRKFSSLGSGLADNRAQIQALANTGQLDFLTDAGLVDPRTGSIDMEKVFEYQRTATYDPSAEAHDPRARKMRGGKSQQLPPTPGYGQSEPGQPQSSDSAKFWEDQLTVSQQQVKVGLTMSDTLMRIEQRLMEGIFTYSPDQAKDNPGMFAGLKDQINQRRKGWSTTIGDLRDMGMKVGKRAFGLGKSLLTGGAGSMLGGFKGTLSLGKTLLGGGLTRIRDSLDVWLPGERTARLQAAKLKAGEYIDEASGKVIKSLRDIKGAVVDKTGKVILSVEEARDAFVKRGLGRKALAGISRLAGMAGGVANSLSGGLSGAAASAFGFLKDHHKAIGSGIGKAARFGKDMLGKGLGLAQSAGSMLFGGLSKIPGRVGSFFNKLVLPDGIMFAGSKTIVERLTEIRDLLIDRLPGGKKAGDSDGDGDRDGSYEDLKNRAAATSSGGDQPSFRERMAGLFSRKGKAAPAEGEDGDTNISVGGKGRRKMGKAPKGLWNKAKWLGRGALGVAGSLGGLVGLGELGGLAGAGSAVAGGLGTAGAWALGALGTVATGVGAVLSSPVVLGALAVAAVGAAGYYGYKALTKKRLTNLSKARYAQYGFAATDSDHLQTVFGLEDRLESAVTWGSSGPKIDDKKIDVAAMLKDFGVDPKNDAQVSGFTGWLQTRFKPVFLTHLSALKAAADGKSLSEVESLKVAQKKRYFNLAKFPDGGYDRQNSPFPGGKALIGASEVSQQIAATQAVLDKEKDTEGAGSLSGTVPVAAAVAATATTVAATQSATPGTGAAQSPSSAPSNAAPTLSGASVTVSSAGTMALTRPSGSPVSALDTIRFKAYGLQELVVEKVRSLDLLEVWVAKSTRYSGKGEAYWTGNIGQTLMAAGASFGVEGMNNNGAYAWQSWFQARFLPVWLAYASAVRAANGKEAPAGAATLNAAQSLQVGLAVYTAPVWGEATSPWEGYTLSSSSRVCEANFQSLKEAAKKTTLPEEKSTAGAKGVGADSGRGIVDGSAGPGLMSRAWSATKDVASKAWEGTKKAVSAVRSAAGSAASAVGSGLSAAGSAISAAGSGALALGGRALTAVKDGVGGLFSQLPMPTGEGSYGAMKALIDQASSMVGVDPKLMATMAAIESGFKSGVKASTSSATGLYQFISSTWKTMLQKYGSKYGIPADTSPTDPRANALMGAEFIKENAKALTGVKDQLTDTDLYLAHFLGAGGAKTFLKALATTPDAVAATIMPAAATANKPIFYNQDGSPRTISAVYAEINRRVRSKGQAFGLNSGADVAAAPTAGTAAKGTAPAPLTADAPNSAPIIPVASTPPGVGGPSGPQTAPVGVTAARSVPAGAGDTIGGFAPPTTPTGSLQAQNSAVQSQAQSADLVKTLGALGSTSTEMLDVNKQQLTVMTSMLELMRKAAEATAGAAAATGNNPSASRGPGGRAQPLATPPVSMTKGF